MSRLKHKVTIPGIQRKPIDNLWRTHLALRQEIRRKEIDLKTWLQQNAKHNYDYIKHENNLIGYVYESERTYRFENLDDAIRFKLTWG